MGFLKLGLIAGLLLSWIAALAQGTFSVRSARATVDGSRWWTVLRVHLLELQKDDHHAARSRSNYDSLMMFMVFRYAS